jgi:hypothetical protein
MNRQQLLLRQTALAARRELNALKFAADADTISEGTTPSENHRKAPALFCRASTNQD